MCFSSFCILYTGHRSFPTEITPGVEFHSRWQNLSRDKWLNKKIKHISEKISRMAGKICYCSIEFDINFLFFKHDTIWTILCINFFKVVEKTYTNSGFRFVKMAFPYYPFCERPVLSLSSKVSTEHLTWVWWTHPQHIIGASADWKEHFFVLLLWLSPCVFSTTQVRSFSPSRSDVLRVHDRTDSCFAQHKMPALTMAFNAKGNC